jgi:hypothetical protein
MLGVVKWCAKHLGSWVVRLAPSTCTCGQPVAHAPVNNNSQRGSRSMCLLGLLWRLVRLQAARVPSSLLPCKLRATRHTP